MTRLLALSAAFGLALPGCTSTSPAEAPQMSASTSVAGVVTVGQMTDGPALTVDEALAQASSLDGQTVRVAGTIRQVCQAMGCWMTFSTAQGQTVRVLTHAEGGEENEALTFPKDASGRHAEVVGTLQLVEESVARRQHLAEDAGATAAEIAAITEPLRAVSLVATGARISAAQ